MTDCAHQTNADAADRVHDGRDTVVPLATEACDGSTVNHAETALAQRYLLALRFGQGITRLLTPTRYVSVWLFPDIDRLTPRGPLSAQKQTLAN